MSFVTIIVCTLLCAAFGFAFCIAVKPRFTATAQLLIEPVHSPVLIQDSARSAVNLETETGRIESQIQVIKSAQIARAVVEKLELLSNPEFAPRDEGQPFYATLIGLFSANDLGSRSADDLASARMTFAVDTFSNRLTVRRVGQSFVTEIQFVSEDARRASEICNAVLAAYIDADVSAKADAARRGSVWLNERLDELRDQVAASRGALERFRSSTEVENVSDRIVKYAQLESLTQTQSRLYEAFLQRSLETVQRITYPVPDSRIIASAAKPETKSFPKVGLIVAFTGLLGAALGVGVSMVRRSTDRRIRSPQQVATVTGCISLGLIANSQQRRIDRRNQHPLPTIEAARTRGFTLGRRSISDLRSLKVAVNAALIARSIKCIGVTSPGRGEGKTTVVANLGAILAVYGSRILLVDVCHNDRGLSNILAPQAQAGVVDFLLDPSSLSRTVVAHPRIENLFVLPPGKAHGLTTPAEQFAAQRHRSDLQTLTQAFDLVIFDLPGTDDSPEALALAPLLDAVIVVGEYGRTTIDALEDCISILRGAGSEILGLVINKADIREMSA